MIKNSKTLISTKRNIRFIVEDSGIMAKLVAGKKIIPYIGLVGYNNLGDEVLYDAHKKLFSSHQLAPYRRETVLIEKTADLIHRPFSKHAILGGGTLINDGDVWLNKTEALLQKGSKIFCMGTGAESSKFYGTNDSTNKLLKRWVKILSQFEFVGVRGPQSKAILERAGAKNVVITGDTALSLTEEKSKIKQSTGTVGITYGTVAGNPMWGDPKKYRAELIKCIRSIITSGCKVMLLPIWDIDIPSNKSLLQEINHPDCTLVEAFDSYDQFTKKLRECDIFIGQKLHSTILALMNRIPSIMIEYRPKCLDFMSSVGLETYLVRTSDVEHKRFIKLYEKLQKNYEKIRSSSEARILEYKYIQHEYAKKLSTTLEY